MKTLMYALVFAALLYVFKYMVVVQGTGMVLGHYEAKKHG